MYRNLTAITTAVLFVFGSASFAGCGQTGHSHSEEDHEHVIGEDGHDHKAADHEHAPGEHADEDGHEHASAYQCPMLCEGEKTYAEPGKCPLCKMALEEVKHDHDHDDSGHEHDDDAGHEHEGDGAHKH